MEDFKLEKIKKYLDDVYDLTFLDEGIDFSTYKWKHIKHGDIVLRLPKSNELPYGDEIYLSHEIIEKEAKLYQFLERKHIPVPKLYYIWIYS